MFSRKKKEFPDQELKFCVGAVPYQGADDVSYCIFALLVASQAVKKMKHPTAMQKYLLSQWERLISKNAQFLADMEVEND